MKSSEEFRTGRFNLGLQRSCTLSPFVSRAFVDLAVDLFESTLSLDTEYLFLHVVRYKSEARCSRTSSMLGEKIYQLLVRESKRRGSKSPTPDESSLTS